MDTRLYRIHANLKNKIQHLVNHPKGSRMSYLALLTTTVSQVHMQVTQNQNKSQILDVHSSRNGAIIRVSIAITDRIYNIHISSLSWVKFGESAALNFQLTA